MSKQVNITINADGSQAEKAIGSVSKSLDGLSSSAGSSIVKGTALGTVIGKVLTSAFSALTSSIDGAISRLDTLNNFPRVMQNLKISSEDADKSIAILSEKLKGLPTSLDDAAQSVQRFTAANGNIKASTAMFLALNNAILAGGASTQLQRTALEQMSQAYTKGRADAMEWRAMLQAMPAQMNQIAKAMGYTSAALGGDLQTAMQNGEVSMNDFMATIVKLNKEGVDGFASFAEQAKGATNGVGTSITNLKLAIQRGLADIMNAIGQANIAGFFNGIASAISTVSTYVVAFVKVMVAAVNAIKALFGGGKSSAKETSNAVADAGVSAGGLASNASDASKGLGSANKQAKQLKKTLASFDEMNVLQEPQSSGSGGGAGGGTNAMADIGKIDFGDLWGEMDVGASKADEIAEKIKNAFKNAFDFISKTKSFDSLKNAFTKVGNAIATNWKKAFGNLKSIAETTLGAIGNSLQKYAGEYDTNIAHMFDGLGSLGASIVDALSMPLNSFLQGFASQWQNVAQSVTDSVAIIQTTMFGFVGDIAEQVSSLVDVFTESFSPGFEELGTLMANVMTDWYTSLAEWLPQITASFTEFFTNLNEGLFKPVTATLGTIWSGFCKTLSDWWNQYGKSILTKVGEFINGLVDTFNKLWTDVLEPIVKPFLDEFVKVWENNLKPAIKAVMDFVGTLIESALTIYNKFIKPIIDWLVQVLKPIVIAVGTTIGGVVNTLFATIGNVVKNIFSALKGLIDFITGVFTGDWKKAWEGVKTIFKNIADALGNIFKAPINFIIDIINGFIEGLNHIKIPDWVPAVGGKGINIPKIQKLAKGGVVDGATMAIIGESGREAVLPLENNTEWIQELAQQVAIASGGGQPSQIIVKLGEETILDKIIDGVNEKSTLSGRNAILV